MKGFGIEIKNDLLEPKHVENMGEALWLYLWLLDKMTSVSEEGVGKILGGKPIKYEEVRTDLGISQRTYTRYVSTLRSNGYISTTIAPYGIVFRITKAYKRFNNRYAKNDTPVNRGTPNLAERYATNAEVGTPRTQNVIKTVTVDNTKTREELSPKEKTQDFLGKGESYTKTLEWLQSKGITAESAVKELDKFISYWTELNSTGNKQRWEMEKTFEVQKRLAYWLSKVNQFTSKPKGKMII